MIKEVTTFIATKAVLTRDTDLFAGHRPQGTIDACDVVIESSGGSVFFDLPDRADIVFQVLSRATTYFKARARAWNIYNTIFMDHSPVAIPTGAASAGWTLPIGAIGPAITHEIMIIEPLAPPQYIGQDEKSRYEFSCNYIFKIKKL